MANDKLEGIEQDEVGDLDCILSNQSVSDLSWLDISEEDYRASESLPKQNLDIIPELQTALMQEGDERVPRLIPLRPHTTVNTNPLDRPEATLRVSSQLVRNRVASYIISGLSSKNIAQKLRLEFSPTDLQIASDVVQPVLDERGLLGNVYIDSSHFPRCHQNDSDRKFVATHSKRSLFVLSKDECAGCVHNKKGNCGVFQKRIVDEVPYTSETLAHYAVSLNNEGRLGDISNAGNSPSDRKLFLKQAFSRSPRDLNPEAAKTIHHYTSPKPVRVTAEDVTSYLERRLSASNIEKMPGPFYLKAARQMMLGLADLSIIASSSNPEVRTLVKEHGLLGHTYLDMDAMGGCRPTLDLVKSKGLSPDFIIRRSASCSMCQCVSDGACAELNSISSVVTMKPIFSKDLLSKALERAMSQERITETQVKSVLSSVTDKSNWVSLIAQANLFAPSNQVQPTYSGGHSNLYYSPPGPKFKVASMNPNEVHRTISHLMNTGLSGKNLLSAVMNRYSKEDLSQVSNVVQRLASNDRIQGNFFIDPTAYSDYGHGCSTGSNQFRKRGAKNVLASDSCTGCSFQTHPGWCSKYSKDLIRQIPEEVRLAASKKRSLKVIQDNVPVENPVEKYGLANELTFDPITKKPSQIEIHMAAPSITD